MVKWSSNHARLPSWPMLASTQITWPSDCLCWLPKCPSLICACHYPHIHSNNPLTRILSEYEFERFVCTTNMPPFDNISCGVEDSAGGACFGVKSSCLNVKRKAMKSFQKNPKTFKTGSRTFGQPFPEIKIGRVFKIVCNHVWNKRSYNNNEHSNDILAQAAVRLSLWFLFVINGLRIFIVIEVGTGNAMDTVVHPLPNSYNNPCVCDEVGNRRVWVTCMWCTTPHHGGNGPWGTRPSTNPMLWIFEVDVSENLSRLKFYLE